MTGTWDANLSEARPGFVTHLECSMTEERHEAGRLHGLSRAGWPLLVRYDLAAARTRLTKAALAERPADLWRWRELLPGARAGDINSPGEAGAPPGGVPPVGAAQGGAPPPGKGEGGPPTRPVQARGH